MNPQRVPLCPDCGKPMVLRTARRGRHAGKQFYGCSGYPKCKTIVDIDDVDEQISVQAQQPQNREPLIDLPPIPDKPQLRFPRDVTIHQHIPGRQTSLLETVSVIERLPNIIRRSDIPERVKHAFAQWRLDYPLPLVHPGRHPYQSVLSVMDKILKRGTNTVCSPSVRNICTNEIDKIGQLDDEEWVGELHQLVNCHRTARIIDNFESDAEQIFYQEILPSIIQKDLIYPWILSQISASSLTFGDIPPDSNQRVDFLISHPLNINCVVEIDGPQHESIREADQMRDKRIREAGLNIIRIPTQEIFNKSGKNIERLKNILRPVYENRKKDRLTPHQELLALVRISSQIQITLLESVKGGYLRIVNGSEWLIGIDEPSWLQDKQAWDKFLKASIYDFIDLLKSIFLLHTSEPLKISAEIIHKDKLIDTKPTQKILVSVNPDIQQLTPDLPCFQISDIYVPFTVANYLLGSTPIKMDVPDVEAVKYLLDYIFQKDGFLEGQWEAIQRTIQGYDSLLLLPTGGGKTIAFQLASFILPGPCLVVDPLISLIEDQIENLHFYGIDRAVGISGLLTTSERHQASEFFMKGYYSFVYIAPERLQIQEFRDALRGLTTSMPISVIVIDEAHCVSEWGHDFRTSYLNIARNSRNYCQKDGVVPSLLGLTGTASSSVLRDVRRELEIMDFDAIITPQSFDRPELHFQAYKCLSTEKQASLIGFLNSLPGRFGEAHNTFFTCRGEETIAGLVFYPFVNGALGVVEGYQLLRESFNASVAFYSGKSPRSIPPEKWNLYKSSFADQFRNNEVSILSCTQAFGMGIDKQNIRYTVHMNMPRSIEAFYQEAGRAGRNRLDSECCLIVSLDNLQRARKLLDPSTPLSEIDQIMQDIPWRERDDISRMMWFHQNAFKGANNEMQEVKQLISELQDLQFIRTEEIVYKDDAQRTRLEKAIHRLVIIGVVDDYVMNYANQAIEIRFSGNEKEDLISSLINYIRNYDRKIAENLESKAIKHIDQPYNVFVLSLLEYLIKDFIYNIVELGRRRSLSEMMELCLADSTDHGIRTRILNYLELGRFTDLLDKAREDPNNLINNLNEIIQEIGSPNEAAEFRGQTARLLEAYPTIPSLLLFRSLSEVMCRDRSEAVIFENFDAFVTYALSEEVWNLPPDQVLDVSVSFINHIGSINSDLAKYLAFIVMDHIGRDRKTLRMLVKDLDDFYSLPAVFTLMNRLDSTIGTICT